MRTGIADVRAISPVDGVVTAGNAKQEAFQRAVRALEGQRLPVEVISLLDDGSFLVKVAGSTVQMSLPQSTRTGDMLSMTLVSTTPRPTFLLETGSANAEPSLSPAARLIANLLQIAQKSGTETSSALNHLPVLQNPAASAEHIATALRETMHNSGIFYESHLAAWAEGNYSLADLKQQPQARLAEQAARILASDTEAPQKIATHTAELARLVNQQLETLEHQQVVWRGEIWPGQPIEWTVQERPGQEAQDNTQAVPTVWQSTVRFDLPALGKVAATMYLQAGQLRVHVSAASENTRTTLQAQSQKLSASLDAAGSPLSAFLVKHDASI